jgi:manganese-dependent inorganic pyrophosphatase
MKYILGHKNPDTDTICSGIAYQDFLTQKNIEAKKLALGKLNNETKLVLEKFNIEEPEQIDELPLGTEIILVDHNEEKQSINNLQNLEIVEIIDHHKIKIETDKPISIIVKPLGSSCSIIAEKYFAEENEITLSKNIAGILLAGIISDTLFFRSPTTTEIDKNLAEKLSHIAEVENMEEFSLAMFEAKSDLGDIDVEELIRLDYKVFDFPKGTYGIGVMETTNINFGLNRQEEIIDKLKEIKKTDNLAGIFFVIVDILNEKSYTLCADETDQKLFIELFSAENKEGVLEVDKLVSRKKQIAPIFEKM